MSTYNYEPAYPLNTEAGSTEKPNTAVPKIKSEFERIYRLLNGSFSSVESLIADARDAISTLQSNVNSAVATLHELATTLRSEMTTLMNTKAAEASTIGTYTELYSYATNGAQATVSGTATKNGFIIVWFNNSGSGYGTLVINNSVVGMYTGDGTYGGAVIVGTFPIASGQAWSWSGDAGGHLHKIMFAPLGA